MLGSWDKYFLKMCKFVSSKSKDPSTKVGCVIVGPDNEIRSTGYNGFGRGVAENKEDLIAMQERGGYSDITEEDIKNVEARWVRPEKYMWVEHAERNAIYNAARVGIPLKGCTIYVQMCPCADCARGIIQSGIVKVVVNNLGDLEFQDRWKDHIRVTEDMLNEAGVEHNL